MNRAPLAAANSAWQTRSPWAGIAFAILFVAGFLAMGETPDYTDRQGWLDYHEDSGNRWQQIIAAYLAILSAFAFLWFAIAMIARFGGSRGGGDVLSGVARAATTIFVAFVILAFVAAITVSAAVEIGEAPVPESADFAIMFDQFGFGLLLVGACLAAAAAIGCITELIREQGGWPRWLVWFGFIAAALLLLGPLFFPLLLLPLWTLVASIMVLVRSRGLAPIQERTAIN